MSILRWFSQSRTDVPRNGDGSLSDPSTDKRSSHGRRRRRALTGSPLVDGGYSDQALGILCSRLTNGAEAFLCGEYATHLHRHGEVVPGWARLNTLAHGDVDSLRRAERSFAVRRPETFADLADDSWKTALRVLAREVNQLVGADPDLLVRLQQSALVPLEFRLMSADALTAYELVQLTRAAVRSSIS